MPLDYHAPDGRKIEIAVSRLANKNPSQRRGVLLTNPGGPGASPALDFPFGLIRVIRTGVRPASMIMRARVLLALDTSQGVVDPKEVIAARLGISGETLHLVAKRFVETGGDVRAASVSVRCALAGDR